MFGYRSGWVNNIHILSGKKLRYLYHNYKNWFDLVGQFEILIEEKTKKQLNKKPELSW
jgi:hypothetical protein